MAYRHERELASRFPRYFSRTRSEPPAKRLFRRRLLEAIPAIGGAILGIALLGATVSVPEKKPAPAAAQCEKAAKYVHVPPSCVYDYVVRRGSDEAEVESEAKKHCQSFQVAVEQDHPAVKKVVEDAIKSRGPFSIEQAFDIYDFLITKLRRQDVSRRLHPFPASQTLSEGFGDCKNLSAVLAAAIIHAGGKVRIVIDHGKKPEDGHLFLELELPEGVSAKYLSDIINRRYRVQDRIPFVEDSKKLADSLNDLQRKISEKTVKRLRSVLDGLKASKASSKEDVRRDLARLMQAQLSLTRIESVMNRALRLQDAQRTLAAELAKALGDEYLWVGGNPVVYNGVMIAQGVGKRWLVMDLTTGSYPGYFSVLRKYHADVILYIVAPE